MFLQSREIFDRKSLFVAYLYPVTSEKEISQAKFQIKQSHSTPPDHSIYAYRFIGLKTSKSGLNQDDFTVKSAYDDDGEKWAGKRILEALEQSQTIDALIVVCRWYGGVMLGPVRFQHIKDLSTELCDDMKRKEGLNEAIETLKGLDDSISALKGQLGMERKAASYENMDTGKAERLIKARKGTLDILKKKMAQKVESKSA